MKLPALISDNMVLQQRAEAPLWGWASPGDEIRISASWLSDAIIVQAGPDGRWTAKIATGNAGGPHAITFDGRETVVVKNVMFGEVWLCSGQSNMQMPLQGWPGQPVLDSDEAIRNSENPALRFFEVSEAISAQPLDDCRGAWQQSRPETTARFSATAYFFGKKLHEALGVPIGLINVSWNGTRAECWMRQETLARFPELQSELARLDSSCDAFEKQITAFEATMFKWGKSARYDPVRRYTSCIEIHGEALLEREKTVAMNRDAPDVALNDYLKAISLEPFPAIMASALYNGMIHPLIPFAIRGAIWYQGESNAPDPALYARLFPALIRDWRQIWQQGDFPFYYVQIAPHVYLDNEHEQNHDAAGLREVQRKTLSVPNTGMAVTMDIGDLACIHPANKQAVGERLARWALATDYGRDDVVCSGPLYRSMSIEKGKIRLYFDYAENGLLCKGERLIDFEIAGTDGIFVSADAMIEGKSVIVSSADVPAPRAVRYGWRNDAEPNLFNRAGLPASPFQTDESA